MRTFEQRVMSAYQGWNSKLKKKNEKRNQRKLHKFRPERKSKRNRFSRVAIVGPWTLLANGIEAAIDERGYYRLRDRRLMHRAVYQKAFGPIPYDWVVHHINHDKKDNDPANLISIPDWFHGEVRKSNKKTGCRLSKIEIIKELKAVLSTARHKVGQDGLDHIAFLEARLLEAASAAVPVPNSTSKIITISRKKTGFV